MNTLMTRVNTIFKQEVMCHFNFSVVFLAVCLVCSSPALARVDQHQGKCFERLVTCPSVTKQLGKCMIYIGTYGFHRVLWGFHLPNGKRLDAWQDNGRSIITLNGKPGYMFSSSGRNPDALRSGQYFCLGYKGVNLMVCGYLN